jgi:hypothetical protein
MPFIIHLPNWFNLSSRQLLAPLPHIIRRFLLCDLLSYPEEGVAWFLRNIDKCLPHCMARHPEGINLYSLQIIRFPHFLLIPVSPSMG